MAGERRAPLCACFDRGARPPADKGLGHFDIARARQMIEMRAEVTVGAGRSMSRVGRRRSDGNFLQKIRNRAKLTP